MKSTSILVVVLRLGTEPIHASITDAVDALRHVTTDLRTIVAQNPRGRKDSLGAAPKGWILEPQSENVGYAVAVNSAVRTHAAVGTSIVILTADARPERLALTKLIEAVGPSVVVGPMLRVDDVWWLGGRWNERWGWARHRVSSTAPDDLEPVTVDWVDGSCLVFSIDTFDTVGGFDEGTFLYGEDVQFCLAHRAAGGIVVVLPAAVVEQKSGMLEREGAHGYLVIRNEIRAGVAVGRSCVPLVLTGLVRCLLELVRGAAGPNRQFHVWQAFGMVRGAVDGARGRTGRPPALLARRSGIP